MGVRLASTPILFSGAVTLVTTAETSYATTGPISEAVDNAVILLWYAFTITIGTTGNLLTPRIRRGTTLASTPITQAVGLTVVAANVVQVSGFYFDTPGVVAGQQYTFTAQVGAATANSTISDSAVLAVVL